MLNELTELAAALSSRNGKATLRSNTNFTIGGESEPFHDDSFFLRALAFDSCQA